MPTPTSDPARQTLLGAPEAFASLACVANRLRRGIGHVQIEATGDSITRGPTKRRMSYPAQLNQLLHSEFPLANVTVRNRGLSGGTLEMIAACHHRMASSQADIVVLETTDNLGFTTPQKATKLLEQIVAALRRRTQPRPEIVLVSPFAQDCARRLLHKRPYTRSNESTAAHLAACFSDDTLPSAVERLAARLGIPCVSMRAGLRSLLMTVTDPQAIVQQYVQQDAVHPNYVGYSLLARGLFHAFQRAAAADCHPPVIPSSPPTPPSPLTCAFGEEMRGLVVETHGWAYVTEHSRQGAPKPGYVTRVPGATLDLCHHGKSVWQFAYLKSYEGMGRARGQCVGGCSCKPRIWDGLTPSRVSQSTISKLAPIKHHSLQGKNTTAQHQGCRCVVRLTSLPATSGEGPHKFKIDALFSSFRIYSGAELNGVVDSNE